MYSEAYGQDPGFFAFWRTMQAYEAAFASGKDRLVLTPGNDFLHLLQTAPSPAP
jgi:modulator of FtsH protease HflC